MQEQEYKWGLILKVSFPAAIVVGLVFYKIQSDFLKWLVLIIGVFAAGGITYSRDKKKSNVFTAAALVLLTAIIILVLRRLSII